MKTACSKCNGSGWDKEENEICRLCWGCGEITE